MKYVLPLACLVLAEVVVLACAGGADRASDEQYFRRLQIELRAMRARERDVITGFFGDPKQEPLLRVDSVRASTRDLIELHRRIAANLSTGYVPKRLRDDHRAFVYAEVGYAVALAEGLSLLSRFEDPEQSLIAATLLQSEITSGSGGGPVAKARFEVAQTCGKLAPSGASERIGDFTRLPLSLAEPFDRAIMPP